MTADMRSDIKLDYRKYLYKVDTSGEHTLYFRNVDGPWLTNLMSPQYQNFVPEPLRHRGVLWWRAQVEHGRRFLRLYFASTSL